ncbi:MAG: HNH endonuclease [Deltaproteobacteria bacterium]
MMRALNMLTVQEAAKMLDVSDRTVQRAAVEGKLNGKRVRASFYFTEEAIKAYRASHPRASARSQLLGFGCDGMRYCRSCYIEKPIEEFYLADRHCCKACKSQHTQDKFETRRAAIFERDKWVCQICHKKINPKLKYPHPMSATIDHIIPSSLGGMGTGENLQAAHWICNSRKRTKAVGCQLRVFG